MCIGCWVGLLPVWQPIREAESSIATWNIGTSICYCIILIKIARSRLRSMSQTVLESLLGWFFYKRTITKILLERDKKPLTLVEDLLHRKAQSWITEFARRIFSHSTKHQPVLALCLERTRPHALHQLIFATVHLGLQRNPLSSLDDSDNACRFEFEAIWACIHAREKKWTSPDTREASSRHVHFHSEQTECSRKKCSG